MIDDPLLATYLHLVRVAGLVGDPMPDLFEPSHTQLSDNQMHQVNTVYEQSRAEHRQRTMRKGAR